MSHACTAGNYPPSPCPTPTTSHTGHPRGISSHGGTAFTGIDSIGLVIALAIVVVVGFALILVHRKGGRIR